ncbi:MAG TPA: ABC transporter permease [Gaiellaceae bacterium]
MTYALRSFEYWVYSYRRVWRGSVVTSIVGPVLYLTALGVGLGKLVNRGAGVGVPYLDYVAPGILAATAMQLATFESAYPVMAAIRWTRQYFAMLATPLRTRDVLLGHQLYVAARLAVVAVIYLVVLAAFGALHSPYAILAWPAAILLGLAHSAPVSAFSAWLERDEGMNGLFRFVVMPMFLFSGTFFPVSRLPHVAREIAYATPLWNGVDLMRHLTLGTASLWPSLAHVAYLALWVAGGLVLASRMYARRLVT